MYHYQQNDCLFGKEEEKVFYGSVKGTGISHSGDGFWEQRLILLHRRKHLYNGSLVTVIG